MAVVVAAWSLGSVGCLTGTYLGARTPPKGTLTKGVVVTGAGGRNVLPVPQANPIAAYSPSDDVSVHVKGLLPMLGAESTLRWRFARLARFHFALAPTVAGHYWPADRGNEDDGDHEDLGPSANLLARLFVLCSLSFEEVDLNVAGFAGVSRIAANGKPELDSSPYATFLYEMQGVVSVVGAAIGLGFPASGGQLRPSLEWTRFVARHRRAGTDDPPFVAENVWTLSVAWDR